MPRPKLDPDAVYKVEVRMTPPDQRPIENWKAENNFDKLIVAEEGVPDGKPRLHYHLYLETKRSESWVRDWIRCVLAPHLEVGVDYNGNKLFFTRKPHSHTIPYVIKHRNILVRIGFTDQLITDYFKQSDEYVKAKQSSRKRAQRNRLDEMNEVFSEIEKDNAVRTPSAIIERALYLCQEKGYTFPSRVVMEQHILRIMYRYDQYVVRSFYERPFERY